MNQQTHSPSNTCKKSKSLLALLFLWCSAGIICLSGCATTPSGKAAAKLEKVPSYEPVNVHRADTLPPGIRRVVLLPVWHEAAGADYLRSVDSQLASELTRKNLFEVIAVNRVQLSRLFSAEQLASFDVLPHDFLSRLKGTYDADAVLLVDLTRFDPYQPMSVGLRAKLIQIETTQMLWAFDDLFDSGNPTVAMGARRFQAATDRKMYPLDNSGTVLQSPERFLKYVTHTMFGTLPPR